MEKVAWVRAVDLKVGRRAVGRGRVHSLDGFLQAGAIGQLAVSLDCESNHGWGVDEFTNVKQLFITVSTPVSTSCF
jgi:hypothetical protein